jgi:hypothetical protein
MPAILPSTKTTCEKKVKSWFVSYTIIGCEIFMATEIILAMFLYYSDVIFSVFKILLLSITKRAIYFF